MTRFTLLAVALLLPHPSWGQPAQTVRIAHFRAEQAFAASAFGKAAIGDLERRESEAAARAAQRSTELDRRRQELARVEGTLGPSARREQERALAKFELDTKRFMEDLQADLFQTRQRVEAAFLLRLRPAVAAVAKLRGLALVLDADAGVIVWADPALDITAEVAAQLGAGVGK